MKSAKEWAAEFTREHIINTREINSTETFIKKIQVDAIEFYIKHCEEIANELKR